MNWRHTDTLLLSALMIIVCFQLHISYADVEVQTATPDNSYVEQTVEGYRTVPEMVTRPTQLDNGRYRRSAVPSYHRWPNAVIPYVFAKHFNYKLKQRVRKAMYIWQKYTCVQFRPKRHNDKNWVNIKTRGCYSNVGMAGRGQSQSLGLGYACEGLRSILHELAHSIGLNHEHNRPDRDHYINVYPHRIQGNLGFNFKKLDSSKVFTFGTPYDFYSITHYSSRTFARGREEPIVTKDKRMMAVIGTINNPSFYNYKIVNLMYKCGAKCPKKRCRGEGFLSRDCICYCKTNTPTDPVRKCSELECRDVITTCRQKAKHNGCMRNLNFMSKYCKKTCGKCPGRNIYERKKPECRDLITTCRQKAKYNGCTRNFHYMSNFCKKTCGKCPGRNIYQRKKPECRDLITTCRQKAKYNGCTRNFHYMSNFCKKTCGKCPGRNIYQRKKPECRDLMNCKYIRRVYKCKARKHFVSKKCRKTCGYC
ncbi:zinc metalloproteinase nas-8 isoform X2 [Octopus bimaculoides]|uniref:Metalloendopeptidase n=1 Tax=Octopus bimaculoides TaxID=37653 RepID=A0A0L8GL20_OCTBM|nr:zinc metalloproteinase nas-8 isoform X2 [Octopus bimaculoides]|eukprot:XP_014780012.1 PREDICTED: zinc metalloproteinase nas-8-like isoform X2 [Octopus bimaculoides]